MKILHLIAHTASEAKLLAGLLRFFQPPIGITIRFIYPEEASWDFDLDFSWLQQADTLPKDEPRLYVVNSVSPYPGHQSKARLLSSSAISCLKTGADADTEKLFKGLLKGFTPCCLDGEDLPFDKIGLDGESLIEQFRTNQILVTHQDSPGQLVYINAPDDLWQFWLGDSSCVLALKLDETSASYLRSYRQLMALCSTYSRFDQVHLDDLRIACLRQSGSYSFFAEFYDRFMVHVDYQSWITMIFTWLKHFLPDDPEKVLEMACGTANISEQLVFRGLEVDACDASPFMLYEASQKCFKPRLFLAFLQDKLPFENRYDLILCLFDSINYLQETQQIASCFHSAAGALKPGGVFVFDISTINNSRENFFDYTQQHRFKDAQILHHASFDELNLRQRSSLTLFRKKAFTYTMSEEHHCQRVYRHTEMMSLIAGCEMELVGIFTPDLRSNLISKRNQYLDERYPRLFYMLRKDK